MSETSVSEIPKSTNDLLEQARRNNAERISKIATQHQTGPNPIDILGMRLEALVYLLLGDEERAQRQRFELQFENDMVGYIDQLEQMVNRSRLMLPPA